MNREAAERCTILRGLVGSTVHGLNVNDGIEDRDEMGVCIEPIEEAMSLWSPFEQFIYRSAVEREGRHGAGSTAGDLDLTIYSLPKWMRLALRANPTILLLLFTPVDQLIHCDAMGSALRAALTPAIISRRVRQPFLGVTRAQIGPRGCALYWSHGCASMAERRRLRGAGRCHRLVASMEPRDARPSPHVERARSEARRAVY